jgi:Family of unknown function (DUF6527)
MSAKGKLRIVPKGHAAYCHGCEEYHVVYDSWQFNGDYDSPTFSPSLLVRGYSEKSQQDYVCHSFVRDGQWEFLGDCSHGKAGQTIPLRDEESL